MLRIIECVEMNYDVKPFEGFTFEKILQLLQRDEAQVLHDPDTGEKGVYVPTPRQHPGVKKVAAMEPHDKERKRSITYGHD